jgi:hypothetical protein
MQTQDSEWGLRLEVLSMTGKVRIADERYKVVIVAATLSSPSFIQPFKLRTSDRPSLGFHVAHKLSSPARAFDALSYDAVSMLVVSIDAPARCKPVSERQPPRLWSDPFMRSADWDSHKSEQAEGRRWTNAIVPP